MNIETSAFQTLFPFVRAVVGASKDGVVEFIGSAFLLKNDQKLFLITAAHVLDNQNDKYQLFIDRPDEGLVRIDGTALVSNSIEPRRKDDKLDTAIISLSNDASIKLSNTPALNLGSFDLSYESDYKDGFIVIGFPISKNKRNIIKTNQEATPYGFVAIEAHQQKYSELEVDNWEHIVLDFDSKRVWSERGEMRQAIGLCGLSGAPVWGITEDKKCKVVSLLTEHHQKKKAVVTSKLGGILTKIFC